jgi:hypothetical protein
VPPTRTVSPPRAERAVDADEVVREAAAVLAPEAGEFAHAMARELVDHIPELGEGEEIFDGARSSCEGNITAVLWMLSQGVPAKQTEVPIEAVEFARTLVRSGIELPALLRAYRFGQAIFSSWWTGQLRDRVEDPHVLASALDSSLTFVFEYLDSVCLRIVEAFTEERERWLRSSAAVRAATVNAILAGELVELEASSARLGYELRRHQLGLVLWVEGRTPGEDAFGRLERAALALTGAVGCTRPLLIPAGPGQLWAWANSYEPVELDALEQAALKLCGVHVGVGAWSTGPEGLRRSHEEALHARRVARLAGIQPVPVTCYRDVVVASLLSADLERSQRFVIDTLGPLAAASDYTVRLRETLRAFLAEGSSHVGVARRLHVHENTVAYRVHRAEELMGHPLAARRLETELALALVQVLGDAVLAGAPDS